MRALSELYAAILLFAASVAVAGMLYSYVEAHIPRHEPPRPVRVLELNETHVVCYTPFTVNLTYWQTVGSFSCWLVPNISSSALDPCPPVLEPGTYILVSPPWLCSP
ncbi:hypothetical protein [Pyrodictium abyssi]|uniref:Uncharacterized protein n=1 Tax=Pyrodictium abyssi TaxID=54256 RepID=A0ABN6ZSR2_9CREN|nr:hypothetical protein PABY_21260 [Pyrodictium abyssi]